MSAQPWTAFISVEAVVQIHKDCVARFGGDRTESPQRGCVERSLGAAWNAELYSEDTDSVHGLCFAGCLLFYLAKNNCFVDGNKRVGWASCMEVLGKLGLTIEATGEECQEYCLSMLSPDSRAVRNAIDVAR
ncbi:MAG: Fic family protein [Candidatus Binataceae bacterium]|nr:Fic family protein [Candidatus Binataceae bacterium]